MKTDSSSRRPSSRAGRLIAAGWAGALLLGAPVDASVTITENLGGNWVGAPTIMVANNPSQTLNGAESSWGGSPPYSLGQSFTATVSGTLANIQMYVMGKNTTNVLSLYDMGPAIQYAVSPPASITPGSNGVSQNLLSANLSVLIANTSGAQVMELTFSGADAVPLIGGHAYYFAVVSLNTSSQTYWYRDGGGTDLYPGGAGYRQNSLINGSQTTDFSLAVTLANTNAGPTIYDCVIDWNNVHQRIDGFGASSAWRSTWTASEANMFFSTNSGTGSSVDGKTNFSYNGVGLSLLRSRITPTGTTVENTIMQMAQARGATVWSTPWTPPPAYKSNDNTNGGNMLSSDYQPYANQLAGYVVNMQQQYGVTVTAISVQNEPDVSQDYESCLWTAQQIHDFVPYLRSALVASNVATTKIVAAEDEDWETNLYSIAMQDAAVATNVDVVACHDYSGSPPNDVPAALSTYDNANAALWETETSKLSGNGAFDPSMTDAMYWAGRIHMFMTGAQANAWHYWWLISANADNEGLTDTNGLPAQRMYVLGQYSRFVRPGNYRIDLANYNSYATLASAYKDPAAGGFAIVVANPNGADTNQSFYLTNFTATTVTPWITSANFSLAAQPSVTLSNSAFSYVIPAMSVVTFTGQGLPAGTVAPVLASIPTQTVDPGATLVVTNAASDADVPPLTLAFTLLSGPTNATLTQTSLTNALFTWTPLPSQANTTNVITVQVTDDGNPSQSATTSFTVIVNPVTGSIPTTTTVSSSAGSVSYGTPVTFTATVSPAPTNGETIAFTAGGSLLGTGVLNNGAASYTTAATALTVAGSPYSVQAQYNSDGNYETSSSGALSQTVTAAAVTVVSGLTVNNKTYNASAAAVMNSNNVVLAGIAASDLGAVGLSTNGSTAAFATRNAGNGIAVNISGLVLTGGAAGNYRLVPPALTGNILPVAVTLQPGSGSMKITNNFSSGNNQFEVYNGNNGFSPALSGSQFTNFQCDVRFAPGSATQMNTNGVVVFGHLQFGTRTSGYGQDYFGGSNYGVDVPATNTGWVHVNIPISATSDANLASINNLLIHIYGPSYATTLTGPSVLWVDNLAFTGPGVNYIVDQFNPSGSGGDSYSGGQIGSVWGNWFGSAWVANTWEATNDACGVAANNKVYDGATTATLSLYDTLVNTALSGVLSADLASVALSTNGSTASFASAAAGSNLAVAVTGLTLAGSAGQNYAVAPVNLTANISTLAVMASFTVNNKVYDGTDAATLNATLPGAVGGDDVALATNGVLALFATPDVNDNIAVTVTAPPWTLTGATAVNYTLTPPVTTGLTADITPATATVTANSQSNTCGLPVPALTAAYSGFVNGEDTNVLTAPAILATTATVASPPGTYPITASGAAADNYVFNYAGGTLTVFALPGLSLSPVAAGYQLTFSTVAGQMYQLEYTTNLSDGTWIPAGNPIPGTGGSLVITNSPGDNQGFFILQISQP